MNDLKKMIKASFPLLFFGLGVCVILTFVTNRIAFPIGWLYGWAIGMAVHFVNIKLVDMIIATMSKWVVLLSVIKLPLYAVGLLPGIFCKQYFNLWTAFIALMLPQFTIYWTTFRERRKHE